MHFGRPLFHIATVSSTFYEKSIKEDEDRYTPRVFFRRTYGKKQRTESIPVHTDFVLRLLAVHPIRFRVYRRAGKSEWRNSFIKMCQNTPPQLCWGDEWLPSPLEGEGQGEGGIISSSPPP
jgi:hypothetical protein